MKDFVSLYGDWALVAGAAEGIGASFSIALAGYGMNLILVDKNSPSLDMLANELEKTYRIKTIRLFLDFSKDQSNKECWDQVNNIDFRLMIYIPAYSRVGRFTSFSSLEIDQFLTLNVKTPAHLVHSFLRHRKKGEKYGIILMSSLAGILGPALVAPYASTKAYLLVLAESLFFELKQENTDITACCAGPTSTPTYWKSNPVNQSTIISPMQPDKVATYALKMLGKKPVCIPGMKNRFFYFILTRLSRKSAGKIVSRSMLKMYPDI